LDSIVEELRRLVPDLVRLPNFFESSYDEKADVLYITFERGVPSDFSDFTDDDIVLRYKDGRLLGMTFLHASKRRDLGLSA